MYSGKTRIAKEFIKELDSHGGGPQDDDGVHQRRDR